MFAQEESNDLQEHNQEGFEQLFTHPHTHVRTHTHTSQITEAINCENIFQSY